MEQNNFSLNSLKEKHERGDIDGMLSSLLSLKHHLKGAKNISDVDRETYGILIKLISYPNAKIMDVSMSVLANCCVKNYHRELFRELGGLPHLILIIKTVDNDDILCRACRLIGNLANNHSLALSLNEYNAGFILLKSLETIEDKSTATLLMIFRAVKKLLAVKDYQLKMLPDEVCNSLNNCLNSSDRTLVIGSIEILMLLSSAKSGQIKNGLKISKELIANLVGLSKKEDMTDLAIKCLSSLICFQTCEVWKYLEGSGLSEIFVRYVQRMERPNKAVLEAFYKLCSEGAVRNKVKNAGLFPKLMKFSTEPDMDIILMIFSLFQYDVSSIATLARDKDFISLLTRNITKKGAVRLLSVVSRLDPPVRELLSEENLNIIISHKECHGILRKISQTKKFLNQLILSGRIWEISRVDCLSEDQDQYAESLLLHLLRTGDRDEVENAALAVPFLVKPRHYTLYNILAHNNGITIILRLLKEKTLEERILATVVKLINIFQESFYNDYKNSRGFFDDSLVSPENSPRSGNASQEGGNEDGAGDADKSEDACEDPEDPDVERITFELDCGTHFTANKTLLCKNSPVMDAMLNGHFIESRQKKVRLRCCTAEALKHLELLLSNKGTASDMSIETHLELITLTDKFLITELSDSLTISLPLNQSSCVAILQWCRHSGLTKNNGIIKKKTYEFVFSSSSHLLVVMKNDALRTPLVEEISNYLSTSFLDLL